ncbi:transposase [bacterium]|nr:transposase [bacterium]
MDIDNWTLSPQKIKRYNEDLQFDSIYFPGRKVNKTAYISELLDKGYSLSKIRQLTHTGAQKINNVKKMKEASAPPSAFLKEPKRGRPPKMTSEMKAELILKGVGSISDAMLSQEICSAFGLGSLARSTINSYRHQFKFQYKPPRQRQELTDEHKKKRKIFVYSIFNIPEFPWRSIIFSDESRICLTNDSRWVWRRRGDNCPGIFLDEKKFPHGIMVYGAIGVNYKSKLVITNLKITSKVYTNNIEQSRMIEDLKNREYVFMQDGAPSHKALDTRKWLNTRCDYLAFWPPNSPDLNPIEMLWGIIKTRIKQLPTQPKTIDDLTKKVLEIWYSIDMETINHLVESFYYRLLLVATHDGESIQPFYRHNHERAFMAHFQEAQELLQHKDEDIQLLQINELITKKKPKNNDENNVENCVESYVDADENEFVDYTEDPPIIIVQENQTHHAEINQTQHAAIRRTKWSSIEDLVLISQVCHFGTNWEMIAEKLPGRTPESIRQRFQKKGYKCIRVNDN